MEQKLEDLNKGEIYIIRNKVTDKCYVGQAKKYVSLNNNKWGTHGRWKSHVREALNGEDHCVYLNYAIRKYGPDNFEVTKICDCLQSELDTLEIKYIQERNTIAPNGYNIKSGGQFKPDSQHILKTMQKYETGYEKITAVVYNHKLIGYKVSGLVDCNGNSIPDKEFIKNVNRHNLDQAIKFIDYIEQLNKRNETVSDWETFELPNRIRVTDEVLPPFICALYEKGIHVGYKVNEFPQKTEDGTVMKITKQFGNTRYTPAENLQKTLEYLKTLKDTSPKQIMSDTQDQDMTDIYIIRNVQNGMAYIGKAKKFLYAGKKAYGMDKCWQEHLRDYEKGSDGDFPKLYEAMKEFGPSNFVIEKLDECDDEECIPLVKELIQQYNTLSPNGYNLTDGGKGGKKSKESIEKQKVSISQRTDEQRKVTSEKLRAANLGKVMDKNVRKHAEDADLPKYVCAMRENGVVIGYKVDKFPTGVGEEKIKKQFKCRENPSVALEKAKKHLELLKIQYPNSCKSNADQQQLDGGACPSKPDKKEKPLPQNIVPLYTEKNVVKGYKVEGEALPTREFTESYHNHVNLDRAVKYQQQIQQGIDVQEGDVKRRKKTIGVLPKYIRAVYYDGDLKGYAIDGLTYVDETGNTVNYSKNFSNQNLTLNENLQSAKEHLQEILTKINHGS